MTTTLTNVVSQWEFPVHECWTRAISNFFNFIFFLHFYKTFFEPVTSVSFTLMPKQIYGGDKTLNVGNNLYLIYTTFRIDFSQYRFSYIKTQNNNLSATAARDRTLLHLWHAHGTLFGTAEQKTKFRERRLSRRTRGHERTQDFSRGEQIRQCGDRSPPAWSRGRTSIAICRRRNVLKIMHKYIRLLRLSTTFVSYQHTKIL